MLTGPAHTMTICCPAVTQAAALAAYTGPQNCITDMRNIYDERRKIMVEALDEIGMKYIKPRSGFYVYTDATTCGLTPDEFCTQLLERQQVLVFPAALFRRAHYRKSVGPIRWGKVMFGISGLPWTLLDKYFFPPKFIH